MEKLESGWALLSKLLDETIDEYCQESHLEELSQIAVNTALEHPDFQKHLPIRPRITRKQTPHTKSQPSISPHIRPIQNRKPTPPSRFISVSMSSKPLTTARSITRPSSQYLSPTIRPSQSLKKSSFQPLSRLDTIAAKPTSSRTSTSANCRPESRTRRPQKPKVPSHMVPRRVSTMPPPPRIPTPPRRRPSEKALKVLEVKQRMAKRARSKSRQKRKDSAADAVTLKKRKGDHTPKLRTFKLRRAVSKENIISTSCVRYISPQYNNVDDALTATTDQVVYYGDSNRQASPYASEQLEVDLCSTQHHFSDHEANHNDEQDTLITMTRNSTAISPPPSTSPLIYRNSTSPAVVPPRIKRVTFSIQPPVDGTLNNSNTKVVPAANLEDTPRLTRYVTRRGSRDARVNSNTSNVRVVDVSNISIPVSATSVVVSLSDSTDADIITKIRAVSDDDDEWDSGPLENTSPPAFDHRHIATTIATNNCTLPVSSSHLYFPHDDPPSNLFLPSNSPHYN